MKKETKERFEKVRQQRNTNPDLCYVEGLALIEEGTRENDYEEIAHGEYLMSHVMFAQGKIDEMLRYALSSAAYFEKSNDTMMNIWCKNLLGIAYSGLGQHPLALQCYQEAYQVAREHHRYKVYNLLENNIASEYEVLGEYTTALRFLKKVYQRIKQNSNMDKGLFVVVCYNLADCCAKLDDYEQAMRYLGENERMVDELDDDEERGISALLRARVYYSAGKTEEGNTYADEVSEYLSKIVIRNFEILEDLETIALFQISIGEYERAAAIAKYLWECAEQTGQSQHIIHACRVRARYYDALEDYNKSLLYYRHMDKAVQRMAAQERLFQLRLTQERENANRRIAELKKEMERQIIFQSRDGLTGLLNRFGFSAVMNNYIEEAKKRKIPIGCIFFDIDHFKQYNDTYGHVNGDSCLELISKECMKIEKNKERVHFARFGGDEFFGMMIGYTERDVVNTACELARNVRELNIPHSFEEETGRVGLSLGVMSLIPGAEEDLLDVVKRLDKALYESKAQGRNCIHVVHVAGPKHDKEDYYQCIDVATL